MGTRKTPSQKMLWNRISREMTKADAQGIVCPRYLAMKYPGRNSPRTRKSGNIANI
jgi:hypothetical protein